MNIEFMINVSEPRTVDKVVTTAFTLEGTIRQESAIVSPSILFETDGLFTNQLASVNYAYIPDFFRYYYINEVTHIRNHLWQVDFQCDVLMSFKQHIKNSIAIIEETSTTGPENVNKYMKNDAYATLVKHKTDIIQFPQGFSSTPYFILITAGGLVT